MSNSERNRKAHSLFDRFLSFLPVLSILRFTDSGNGRNLFSFYAFMVKHIPDKLYKCSLKKVQYI